MRLAEGVWVSPCEVSPCEVHGRAVETPLVVSVTPDTGGRQIIGEGESAVYLPEVGFDNLFHCLSLGCQPA